MTTLDNFYEELEGLLKRYDYHLSSIRENITNDPKVLMDLWSAMPSLRGGVKETNLEIRAIRLKKM